MAISISLIAHEVLCLALFYSAFCRAVWANSQTQRRMRFIILMTGSVSSLGMLAPISWGYEPNWFELMLLAMAVVSQMITSTNWRDGVPEIFQKKKHVTNND